MLRPLMCEFHTSANWVALIADRLNLGFLDIQINKFDMYKETVDCADKVYSNGIR